MWNGEETEVDPEAVLTGPLCIGAHAKVDKRIPRAHVRTRALPTPLGGRGIGMCTVVEAAQGREVDLTDGVPVVPPDGTWALVLPDPRLAAPTWGRMSG